MQFLRTRRVAALFHSALWGAISAGARISALLAAGILLGSASASAQLEDDFEAAAPEGEVTRPTEAVRGQGIRRRSVGCSILDQTAFTPVEKRKAERPLSAIQGIVLHQTGFRRGSDADRYRRVTSHFVILPDGQIVKNHPETSVVWASNGFNAYTVAIEFAGNFPSARGRWWKPDDYGRHRPTSAQIASGQCLVHKLYFDIESIVWILAHRQASPRRGNDPGPDIWYEVGDWAVAELEMNDGGLGFSINGGRSIPDSWRTPPGER